MSNPIDDYVRDFTRDVPRSKALTARSVMAPARVFIAADAGAADLRDKLGLHGCDNAVVIDAQDRFVGIALLADLADRSDTHASVASIMRTSCPVAEPNTRLEHLIPLAISADGPIVILDHDRCVGTICPDAAMAALIGDEGVAT